MSGQVVPDRERQGPGPFTVWPGDRLDLPNGPIEVVDVSRSGFVR